VRLALQFPSTPAIRTDLHLRLFNAALQTSRFDIAHSTLPLFTDAALQSSNIRSLITRMCETGYANEMVTLPWLGLHAAVDDFLAQKCAAIQDVTVGVPYHNILYSWRLRHQNFRGAAAIAFECLERLKASGAGDVILSSVADNDDTPVTRGYLAVINALCCVDSKEAWILSESSGIKGKAGKRRVITLEDVRSAYTRELDRRAEIENERFAFGEGDEMDVL
jgi:nuclear pore complex protein Nup160